MPLKPWQNMQAIKLQAPGSGLMPRRKVPHSELAANMLLPDADEIATSRLRMASGALGELDPDFGEGPARRGAVRTIKCRETPQVRGSALDRAG